MKRKIFGLVLVLFASTLFFSCKQVTDEEPTVALIKIKTKPTKVSYEVNQAFDPSGLVITVVYVDKTNKDIAYSATSDITLSKPDMSTAGTKKVIATYNNKSEKFEITVKEPEKKDPEKSDSDKKDPQNTDSGNTESGNTDSGNTDSTTKPTGYESEIDCSAKTWEIWNQSLSTYASKKVVLKLSMDIAMINEKDAAYSKELLLQLNNGDSTYPIITRKTVSNTWTTITVDDVFTLGPNPTLYLSLEAIKADKADVKVYLKNVSVTCTEKQDLIIPDGTWRDSAVPSLYDTYKDQFDYIGIAAEYGNFGLALSGDKYTGTYTQSVWGKPNELYYDEVQAGIARHANSITLGNELKPQFLLQWWSGSIGNDETLVDFTASNGEKIKVPSKLNGENLIYATLNVCKKMDVQMRGHVLTWHSQTPDGFFAENYSPVYDGDSITNLVSPAVMTARHEWYIKTVLSCVDAWEKANNYRAIWAWDVVNEAMADDAGNTYTGDNQDWLRGASEGTKGKSPNNGGGSRWYQVYGNEEFIVNAFRFANAYAPADVKLCYNDYNEYWDAPGHYKTSAICHIAEIVKAAGTKTVNGNSVAPRFDVIAMQSHVGITWPGVNGYKAALERFLAIADVHVSELDFSAETPEAAATAYGEYFNLLQNYGKKSSGTHKVTNVTIWGVNDENSWINPSAPGGKKTYPLLFNLIDNVTTTKKTVTYDTGVEELPVYEYGDSYKPNAAFSAVINAHK